MVLQRHNKRVEISKYIPAGLKVKEPVKSSSSGTSSLAMAVSRSRFAFLRAFPASSSILLTAAMVTFMSALLNSGDSTGATVADAIDPRGDTVKVKAATCAELI